MLENQQLRIKTLEDLVLESRYSSSQKSDNVYAHMLHLNVSIKDLGDSILSHDLQSSKVINDLSDKLHDVRNQLSITTERMLELEIKVSL